MFVMKHIALFPICTSVMKNLLVKFTSTSSASRATSRVVLISTSDNIYENLAFEEWMYEKTDFSDTDYLYLWRNQPAVVCGRHQNPWLEANIPQACADGVHIARRSSGGGTVYHDEGNVNLSFMKSRPRYNRKENLHLVVDAIKSHWDLDLTVTDRDDILLDHFYKVSGTAAKLGRSQSYHHFTLLLGVDKIKLFKVLTSPLRGVDSKATKSVPAAVRNLAENAPDMNFEHLVNVIGYSFLKETNQKENVRFVNPVSEAEFPGVLDIVQRLQSWDWVYGKTPRFSLHRVFSGPGLHSNDYCLKTDIDIEKGSVASVRLHLDDPSLAELVHAINIFYLQNAKDLKLVHHSLSHLKDKSFHYVHTVLNNKSPEVMFVAKWIIQCVDSCFRFL